MVVLQCCVNFFSIAERLNYAHICVCVIYSFSCSFRYNLSQDIDYEWLHSTAGPCCLSILRVIVLHLLVPASHPIPHSLPPLWQPQVCSLYLWVSYSVF